MKNHKNNTHLFQELNDIVNKLRKPGGCDWDRAQTANSLIPYFIEEVYELIDGIDKKDSKNIKGIKKKSGLAGSELSSTLNLISSSI